MWLAKCKNFPIRRVFPRLLFYVLCLSLIAPTVTLFFAWYSIDRELWQHIADHSLPGVLKNSLFLLLGSNILTCVLGVVTAAAVTMLEFPGRKIFQSLFIFPFVVPSYVLGFIYVSVFDSSGLLQNYLRNFYGDLFINIRNVTGLIFVFSLALFPYVFLFCRQAFITQGRKLLEAGKTLGHHPLSCFFLSSYPFPNHGFLGH